MPRLSIDEKTTLLGAIAEHQAEIAALKTQLYIDREDQQPNVWFTRALWIYFVVWFVASAYECLKLLFYWQGGVGSELTMAVVGGIWGATTSGWLSFNQRTANGWEFSDGTTALDPGADHERFNSRLTPGFLTRPFLGVLVGIVVLAGMRAGKFAAADSQYALAFFSIAGGLISKSVLETTKELGKKVFLDKSPG